MKLRLCLIVSLYFGLAVGTALPVEAPPVIAILHTNDVHGRFAASDEAIGHDRIAVIYRETRARIPATLLLDAGDAIQGMPLVKWNRGAAAIAIMNAAGYDALTLGNHEFDYGWDTLVERMGLADFPCLTQPVVAEGEPGFEAAALFERGGRRIGVFGLTTPETRQSSNGGFDRTFGESGELVAYANAMAASLRAAGAEVVVCLAHLGVEDQGFLTSYQLRDRADGIDLIVDGHSHTPLEDIEQVEGRALIASAGEHARAIGLVEFYCVDGRLRPRATSVTRAESVSYEPDPAVTAVIEEWSRQTEEWGNEVVAWSPESLDADRVPMRTRETRLGNLLTDAVRAATDCDAAFLNGGNIRSPLPKGDVTAADLDAMLPYDTTVITAPVRGGVLREALELSVSRYPGEFGGFLHMSGINIVFDPARPAGKRVTRVSVGDDPLDDDRLYSIAVCDWIATGGDGYGMMVEPFKVTAKNGSRPLIDLVTVYLNQRRNAPLPDVEGRIQLQNSR